LPNDLGLFDMHGNLWEWCLNEYKPYPTEEASDDDVSSTVRDSNSRVLRGGSVGSNARDLRSAYRGYLLPGDRFSYFGFRVARTYH
jgi:formylglycine-generating enzyme required for sulfatase activity